MGTMGALHVALHVVAKSHSAANRARDATVERDAATRAFPVAGRLEVAAECFGVLEAAGANIAAKTLLLERRVEVPDVDLGAKVAHVGDVVAVVEAASVAPEGTPARSLMLIRRRLPFFSACRLRRAGGSAIEIEEDA
jgi:hypothetical protein